MLDILTVDRPLFPDVPLYGVIGGLHLSGVTEQIIPETIQDLRSFGLKLVAPGHCTGWRAVTEIGNIGAAAQATSRDELAA
jgi:7,8-dihydropterin-6-yl-methyl-4-(beta-D-ribofuranosyl)aminobenzene 5'-phosphate synthase